MLDKQAKEIIKTFCYSSNVPTILLNSDLICELSNDESFYPVGVHFASVKTDNLKLSKNKAAKTMVRIKDKYYCAVITPVAEELFICQMFDADNIFEMAQLTEIYDEILPIISSNRVQLCKLEDEMKKVLSLKEVKDNVIIDSSILEIGAEVARARGKYDNLQSYFEVSFSKNNKKSAFSLYSFVKWSVDRCNSILANTGRFIDLDTQNKDLLVCADSRHAVFSIIEMIQFALLHSAGDVNPFISIEKENGFVVLLITCRGMIFVKEGDETEFVGSDIVGGLATVRRFAARCGAELKFINEKDNVIGFRLIFPEVQDETLDALVFESDSFLDYDDRYLNYAKYKMQEVVDVYNYNNKAEQFSD